MPWSMVARAAVGVLSAVAGAGGGAYVGTQVATEPPPRESRPPVYRPAEEPRQPSRNGAPYDGRPYARTDMWARLENDRLRSRLQALEGGNVCPPDSVVRLPPRS